MLNIHRKPTYQELVELSNADLSKHVRAAKKQYEDAYFQRDDTSLKQAIYEVFEEERQKRLKLIVKGSQ